MQTDQRLSHQDLGVGGGHFENSWRVCLETIAGLGAQGAQFSRNWRVFVREVVGSREARLLRGLEARSSAITFLFRSQSSSSPLCKNVSGRAAAPFEDSEHFGLLHFEFMGWVGCARLIRHNLMRGLNSTGCCRKALSRLKNIKWCLRVEIEKPHYFFFTSPHDIISFVIRGARLAFASWQLLKQEPPKKISVIFICIPPPLPLVYFHTP